MDTTLAAGNYSPQISIAIPSVTLIGSGSAVTSIGSGGLSCVFQISSATVVISDLLIKNGFGGRHFGICINVPNGTSASLSLIRSLVSLGTDNATGVTVSTTGSSSATVDVLDSSISHNGGGGIVFSGVGAVTIDRSLFYHNGGGVANPAPGVSSDAPGGLQLVGVVSATIANSTFTQNANNASSPRADGGGISDLSGTLLQLNNVTLAANSTTGAGSEIYAVNASIDHSIVAGTCAGGYLGGSYSVESPDNTCALTNSRPNISTLMLNLGYLADNGGPTQTMMLQPGSFAIGVGGAGCKMVDQRDYPRKGLCDSGAVQANGEFIFANGFEGP